MTIRLINKTILHCKCVWCGYEWDAFEKPKRCAGCKRHSWNGEDQRRRDPLEYVPPGSVLDKKPPELRHKDVVDALMLARGIVEQIINDYGPCDHASKEPACVCHEKEVLAKINQQIDVLSHFTGPARAVTYVRVGRGANAKA